MQTLRNAVRWKGLKCPNWRRPNALIIRVESEHVTECFTAFGERVVSAAQVAEQVCEEVQRDIKANVAVGPYMPINMDFAEWRSGTWKVDVG